MARELNFARYKNNLKQYLSSRGVDVDKNPTYCINPEHSNTNTPAMLLYDDYFECKSCGAKGDIYDAVGYLQGIPEKTEQFIEIEKFFTGLSPENMSENKKRDFKPSLTAEKKLYEYLKRSNGREVGIRSYLQQRKCPPEMIEKIWQRFGWWPGYETAERELGRDTLFSAGIPGRNPKTESYIWGPAGPVVKMGQGFKLFYYEGGESKKIASKKGRTFPYPALPESDEIILVEAETSAISMRYSGWESTCACGGVSGINRDSVRLLYPYNKITIIFDGDSAGRRGPWTLRDKLIEGGYTGEIVVARLPKGVDPDDMIKSGRAEDITDAIEHAAAKTKEVEQARTDDKNPPFIFLGYDNKAYYFLPKNQNIPLKINRGNTNIKNHIEEIANADWWFENFTKENRDGDLVFDLPAAMKWLRLESYKRGMYDPEKILGVGPHRDKGGVIINTGGSLLIYGNGEIGYNDYEGELFFCRSKFKFEVPEKGWTRGDRTNFMAQLRTFNFEKTLDRYCVAGFIAVAPFASLLHRCPHIWLTGQRGAGKTYLIEMIIEQALGKFVVKAEGGTSEAGVRQAIGRDCRPVIIDEFEANNKNEVPTIEAILGLARSAYGGSEKIKGSAGHEAIHFRTKMMFCFSSVKTYLSNAANATRIAIVRMKKLPLKTPDENKFRSIDNMGGLKRYIYDRLELLIENCDLAKRAILDAGYDERKGDTYSPLLAGCWMIASDAPFLQSADEKANQAMLRAIQEIHQEETEEDETRIFDHLLQHTVRLDESHNKNMTIAEMLIDDEEGMPFLSKHDNQLRRIGIRKMKKVINDKQIGVLAISANHTEIKRIMSDTAFSEYRDVLARHPAFITEGGNKFPAVRMAGKTERSLLFDWAQIEREYLSPSDQGDEIPF